MQLSTRKVAGLHAVDTRGVINAIPTKRNAAKHTTERHPYKSTIPPDPIKLSFLRMQLASPENKIPYTDSLGGRRDLNSSANEQPMSKMRKPKILRLNQPEFPIR